MVNKTDAKGKPLYISGSSFQVDEDTLGIIVADFDVAIVTGTEVDTTADPFSGNTIADAAPGNAVVEYVYSISSGAADDQVDGIQGNNFVRFGAGNDIFYAGCGIDIVRTGSGDDFGSLGEGDDTVYFIVD